MRAWLRGFVAFAMLFVAPFAEGEEPASVVVTERSAEDQAIDAALLKRQAWVFKETPFSEVRKRFAEALNVNIAFDLPALDTAGVTLENTVSLDLRDAAAGTALELLCRQVELTSFVRDGVLVISTPDEDTLLETRVYDVSSFTPEFDADGVEQPFDGDSLIDLVTSTIDPTSWDASGGYGGMMEFHSQHARGLVVPQSNKTHAKIEQLFRDLTRLKQAADMPKAESIVVPEDDISRAVTALAVKRDWNLGQATFDGLLAEMESATGREFVLDTLDTDFVRTDEPLGITDTLHDASARTALELALHRYGFAWTLFEDVVWITTEDNADTQQFVRAYDVRDLIREDFDWDTLIVTITSQVEANSWTDVGGTGAIQEYETTQIKALVVSQTPQVHLKVAQLLSDLRTLRNLAPQPAHGAPPATPNEEAPGERDVTPPTSRFDLENQDPAIGEQAFAVDLYRRLADDDHDANLLVSPYSAFEALGMVHAGARGQTADELAKALHCGGLTPETSSAAFGVLRRKIAAQAELGKMDLRVANRLWGDNQFPIAPDYLNTLGKDYDSIAELLDFKNPTAAAERINLWTSENTAGRINHIVDENFVNGAPFVLTNALYLKAKWATTFEKQATMPAFFTGPAGKTKVNYMRKEMRCDYRDSRVVRVAAIPYENDRFTMLFVLPNEGRKLADLEKSLHDEQFRKWTTGLEKHRLDVRIPNFRFESGFSLKDALGGLGAHAMFASGVADLSGICTESQAHGVYIGDVLQRTFIEIDEDGTEAAAVTAGGGFFGGGFRPNQTNRPIPFHLDHPFLFAIRDEATGAILFLGRVNKPDTANGS